MHKLPEQNMDEPTDKVAEVANDRAKDNWEGHFEDWITIDYGQEYFMDWLYKCPATLRDLALTVQPGTRLIFELAEAWFKDCPKDKERFEDYAYEAEKDRLMEGR